MSSPFRYNKKERKRFRRDARKEASAADKFEREGNKLGAAAVLRQLAGFSARMAHAKRVKQESTKSK
ncbi:MAG: hypothetical protein ABSF71_23250 [Terriglobia bacterium]|jgi:hypothetical protein